MTDQYDYGHEPTQRDSGQWSERTRTAAPPPAPAPQPMGSTRPHRVELHKPFRTGIFLGFGFMVAALIVAVVIGALMMALGIGLAGVANQLS